MLKFLILIFLIPSFVQAKLDDNEIKDEDLDISLEELVKSEPWEFKGANFTLETRQFLVNEDDENFENQRSLLTKIDLYKNMGFGEVVLRLAGRYDDQDPNRNRVWPEDAYITRNFDDKYFVTAGYKIYNFANLEAFNPLDSINARIFDVSIVNAEKMGELSLGVRTEKFGGNLSFYLLPNPTDPILPGKDSRIKLPQNLDDAVWMGSKDDEPDWDDHFMISWDGVVSDWDFQFMVSKGIDRSRAIVGTDDYVIVLGQAVPNISGGFNKPYYFERYLSGVNAVGGWGDDLLKFTVAHSYYLSETEIFTADQAIRGSSDPDDLRTPQDFTVMTMGFERPLEHSKGLTSTLIFEYQKMFFKDDENQGSFPLQNDFFAAWRVNFNDINSKQLTLSAMYDVSGVDEGFVQLDYSQRFKEVFKFNIGILEYLIPEDADFSGYGIFKDTEHAYLKLTYYL